MKGGGWVGGVESVGSEWWAFLLSSGVNSECWLSKKKERVWWFPEDKQYLYNGWGISEVPDR